MALANSHQVADLNVSEAGRHVDGHVLVALLEPVVLLDVVKVVAADHHGVLHLQEAVGVKLRIILSNTCPPRNRL